MFQQDQRAARACTYKTDALLRLRKPVAYLPAAPMHLAVLGLLMTS